MITSQQIFDLLPNRTLPPEKVRRVLMKVGWLIRGNWVAQAEYVYPDGSVSGTNGVTAEQMRNARDYILYRFTKCDRLERSQLVTITQLPVEEIREILCSIAKLNPADRTWSMLLPSNEASLCVEEQEISERQAAYWKARTEFFNEMERKSNIAGSSSSGGGSTGGGPTSKRVRKRSTRDS